MSTITRLHRNAGNVIYTSQIKNQKLKTYELLGPILLQLFIQFENVLHCLDTNLTLSKVFHHSQMSNVCLSKVSHHSQAGESE